ncbi:Glyoxylate reductase/hydroxypyruvate reductase [Planctomycetales bacterium 10988]|nr:Glyoxylate reductase/hydroxypyruvate reductase [Planctomycetales bacterium 10988]
MSLPKVFVTRKIPTCGLEQIQQHAEVDVWEHPLPPNREQVLERIQGCQGLLCLLTERIDAEVMDAAPGLKVISNYAVGFNNIDIAAATERKISVGNTPDVLTEATADMAITLLLAAARQLVAGDQYVRGNQWKTWEPLGFLGQDLRGRTVGIMGLGRIGYAVAERLHKGWGCKILYVHPRVHSEAETELQAKKVEFSTLLAESDFLTLHCPLTADNQGVFDYEAFCQMKPSSVFVNTARGGLVKQADLVKALNEKKIFAAGLDVTDPEPPEENDPLLKCSNVVLAPHTGSATIESREGMANLAEANLLAGLKGERLPHLVNPQAFDDE